MSTLEKAINLLQTMPENMLEAVYLYMRFVSTQIEESTETNRKNARSIVGIAHEYANPELIPLEKESFANATAEKHTLD